MLHNKIKKMFAVALATSVGITSLPSIDYYASAATKSAKGNGIGNEFKNQVSLSDNTDISEDDEGVFKVTVDDNGNIAADADNEYAADVNTPFSWDNVNVYFVMTDRFKNGDTSNDHSYGRGLDKAGKEISGYENKEGYFHGGDLAGMTQTIEEGYFDKLGTNAIWITAPYEQIHGALSAGGFKHYAYHGYYALDYTEVDANMGTAKDMETFIDTAHEHGIRVIFDIVLNHAGYANPKDAAEFGYGKLADNWEEIYYGWDDKQYKWFNDYVAEASQNGSQGMMDAQNGDWETNWWGSSWVRMTKGRFTAYQNQAEEAAGVETCVDGLPDFVTEGTTDPGMPSILKKKWGAARLAQEEKELDEFCKNYGMSKCVTTYLTKWLTDWVREYGVDGFRCDTAKHVNQSEWGKLKKAGVQALKEWRENNPDKPGAQWKDDFWMTGEHWDHGIGKDGYYTTGGFDSMINFSYQGNENKSGAALEGTYSSYATQINNDPSFNVLSYISSHDTALGARSANAGTALLLTPGGVQTYYGDESGRKGDGTSDKQPTRSNMNWSNMDESILSNWQKVGRFRRNHIAVGAGQHKKISDSPYTFSRTYTGKATVGSETKTDYEDKVVVSLPGSAGTYDIDVSSVFEDGTALTDEYSGDVYTVNGGSVSVTCDNNGVILLGAGGVAKASVGATASQAFTTDTLTIKLSASKTSEAYYILDDGEKISFAAGDTIEIGEGDPTGTSYTLVVGGTGEDGEELSEKTYTYSKEEEPEYTFYLRTKASDYDFVPYVYLYSTDAAQTPYTAAWPGDSMTKEGDYYVYYSSEFSSANVVVNNNGGGWQDPVKDTDMVCTGYMEYTYKSGKLTAFTPEKSTAPTTTKKPTATPKETEKPVVTDEPDEPKETDISKETEVPKATISATATPKVTGTPKVTATNKPATNKPTTTSSPQVTQKPQPSSNVPSSSTDNSGASSDFEIASFTSNKAAPQEAGTNIVLTLKGKGGSGNYTYKYYIVNTETLHQEVYTGWTSKNTVTWIPSASGTYKIYAYICDNGATGKEIKNVTVAYQITSALTIKTFKATKLTKRRVKFTMKAEGEGSPRYKLMVANSSGKKSTIKSYSTVRTKVYTFKKAGTYTVYLYVKDGANRVKTAKKVLKIK